MKLSRFSHLAINHSSFDTSVISLNEMTATPTSHKASTGWRQDERREQAIPIRAPRVISSTKSYRGASKLTLSEVKCHSLIVLALIGASTSHIAGMDQYATPSSAPELAPLRALLNECIGEASIEKAFNETFGLMCKTVITKHDLPASKRWLQSQATKTEITTLVTYLKEQVNRTLNQAEARLPDISQLDHASYFLHVSRTLNGEADQLQKKMALLASLLDDAIATNQEPPYFETPQHLHDSIRRRMMFGCTLL